MGNLAAARWAFRSENATERPLESEADFARRYEAFVRDALGSQRLVYWLAETDEGDVVAHMAVFVVHAIPRPSRLQEGWGYLTDCYTRPPFRNRGIGQELLAHVAAWAQTRDLELLLVWPSERSLSFYARAGFGPNDELRVLRLREFDSPSDQAELRRAEESNDRRD